MRKPRLFKSKRGQIDSLMGIIQAITNVTPAPIKYALFIFIMCFAANFVVSIFSSLMGYYCYGDTLYRGVTILDKGRVITNSLESIFTTNTTLIGGSFGEKVHSSVTGYGLERENIAGFSCRTIDSAISDYSKTSRSFSVPDFVFLGIPIFDWRIWAVMILIGLLVYAWQALR